MKRLTLSERLNDSLNMLDRHKTYILFKVLEGLVEDWNDLSPSEIWKEAENTLQVYIRHPHPSEAIALLQEAMRDRYSSFEIQGDVQQRSCEEVDITTCLVLNATLFLLNGLDDKERRFDQHNAALFQLISDHPLTARFLHSIKDNEPYLEEIMDQPQAHLLTSQKYQPPTQLTFDSMVKAIMCKAATKNGETIKSNAKGHAGSYPFYINAEIFCRAMDEMMEKEADMMMEYLDGSPCTLYLNKVGAFIGRTISMCIINNNSLQMTDMVFAFEQLSTNESSIRTSLSRIDKTYRFKLLMTTFEGYLRRHLLLG